MARFIRLTTALCFVLGISSSAAACLFCDSSTAEQVRAGIFNSDFGYHLGVALAPFPILDRRAVSYLLLAGPPLIEAESPRVAVLRHLADDIGAKMNNDTTRRPLIAAGTALGIGMGGFVDGIVLHQLLQVHNMLSAKYPTRGIAPEQLIVNLQINMFWDGLFHVLTWVMTAVGLALLWHAVRQRNVLLNTKTLIGAMIFGWGLFNLVEGIIDHHILHIHHVTETAKHFLWDLAFLASGVVMIVGGLLVIRSRYEGESQARMSSP